MLKIGQVLRIPILNKEEKEKNTYVVKKGDTLYKIAQNYDTTVNDIIKLNNLINTNLSINQILQIPSKKEYYIVKKGDTLYSIARNNNLDINQLISLNNLTSNLISIGQKLRIK